MRHGLSAILLALTPCLVVTSTVAATEEDKPTSVIAIDDALFTKHTELKEAEKAKADQQLSVDNQQEQLTQLNKQASVLDKALLTAKQALERDYQRMIDEPELDISASQSNYQQAWADVKSNQQQRLTEEQRLQELELTLQQKASAVEKLQADIEKLAGSKQRARADRLKAELRQSQKLSVSFTNVCQSDMTLAQCSEQTTELGLQKAVKQYRKTLLGNATESELIARNAANVSLNIHVLGHKVTDSGFYDGLRFKNALDVNLEARPSETAACRLLNVDNQFCFAPGEYSNNQDKQQETAWVSLSIRSNQYGDTVYVNDVSYGSTPLEVMLPVGEHQVKVIKDGYRTFNQAIQLKSDHTLRAVLVQTENRLKQGYQFADAIQSGSNGPSMVTVLQGEYMTGENASKQIFLDHAFAIGATPITVAQFDTFVAQSGYQTDAELTNTCTTIENSQVSPVEKGYWRNPGFKQFANSPVVCISRNDATAYTKWLSEQTGYSYRLPSEDEWEIAARAGSENKYWWGDQFKPGKANTGWGGTPWSNKGTSPISAFEPNPLGLYDVVGNVWQWTNEKTSLAKGGAWNFSPVMAAAHQQLYVAPSAAGNYIGFRVLREIN
ncbi:SUMF1/EgtB/PvdO family nonheme iron enzyme [Vibrio sp.]|uniref:SUMF1/EgtB/PvdO family nonheme iron enzyme n=1 Tax=Vibrio sp. TaxID=678 RepID=UPI003D0F2D73